MIVALSVGWQLYDSLLIMVDSISSNLC